MKYTREDLLKICEQAFVSEDKWHDRDSEDAQSKLGECYALLKDGCEFEVIYDDDICGTDEYTIWLYTYSNNIRRASCSSFSSSIMYLFKLLVFTTPMFPFE